MILLKSTKLLEEARQAIYDELQTLLNLMEHTLTIIIFEGVIVHRYTKDISIFRHGINNDNVGPIAKASFEETPEMFTVKC